MSQFRETFTRGSKKDSVLSYDDFASRIFTSGFMICFLLPITFYLFKRWLLGRSTQLPLKYRLSDVHKESKTRPCAKCECSLCKKVRSREQNKVFNLKDHLKITRLLQLIVLGFFWWLVIYLIRGINPEDNIKKFDPFELLGLSSDASKKDIQKAYRHLSLKYHPDRNPNDPEMSAHFVLITKAYRTLTNEVSRMNYAKYGNPDGPGMMKIGIGLPRFLVDENNQVLILLLFFVVLLIVVPSLFIWYYRTQKNLTATGVRLETFQLIYHSINENTRHKALPEVYACSAELLAVPYHSSQETELKNYIYVVGEYKKKNITSKTFRNFMLILCHLNRVEDLTPQLANALKEILKYSMLVTQCMLDVAITREWLLTFRSVLDFRKAILQGMTGKADAFYQIPHFTDDIINHVTRGKSSYKHVEDYIKTSFESKKGLSGLTESQKKDVEAYCKFYPDVTLEVQVYVEDEQDIYQGDAVTVEIKLTRNNLKEKELVGPIHAPHFPYVKYEQYFFLVTYPPNLNQAKESNKESQNHTNHNSHTVDKEITEKEEIRGKDWENNIYLNYSTSHSREKVIVEKLQVIAERSGTITLCVTAINDSYFGAEFTVLKRFYAHPLTVQKAVENLKIHPEDLNLDQETNPLAKMLGDLLTVESSEEEEVEYFE